MALEVARALRAPLDVFLVRKLGVPDHEELAMGAIAAGGVQLVNWETVHALGIDEQTLASVVRREERELARRELLYRGNAPRLPVTGRTVILVDDGLATGSTMRAAAAALRAQQPARLVVGVPIAAPATCRALAADVDEIVCAVTPQPFRAVSLWYENFAQTSDDEVREFLALAARERSRRESAAAPAGGP